MEPTFQPYQPQTSSFNPKMKRSPASERNKEAICQVLAEYVKKAGTRVLEVASGFGVHVAHNAVAFPEVVWQPTDLDPESVESIKAHLEGVGNGAVLLFVIFPSRSFQTQSTWNFLCRFFLTLCLELNGVCCQHFWPDMYLKDSQNYPVMSQNE